MQQSMGSIGTGAAALTPKVPDVGSAVSTLENNVESLNQLLETLFHRLQVVCNGSQHEEAKNGACSPIDCCPLSGQIRLNANRLNGMANMINRYLNALEI